MGQILLIELLSGLTCLRKSCKWATRCQAQANNQIAILSAQARTRTQTTITITTSTTTSHKAIILFNAAEPFAFVSVTNGANVSDGEKQLQPQKEQQH